MSVRFKGALLIWLALAGVANASGYGKLLAQANPAATSLTDIYTVASTAAGGEVSSAIVTTIWITNRAAAPHTFRLAMAAAGAADNAKQYLYYDVPIPANSSLVQSVALPLSAGDVVRVYVDAQQFSFSLFGTTTP